MESTQKKSRLGPIGRKILLYTFLTVVVIFVTRYLWKHSSQHETRISSTANFDTLRAVTNLVIWKQKFVINDVQEESKKYLGTDFLSFSETVSTTAKGEMSFYIDLSDEDRTQIINSQDGVIIKTPLEVDRPNIELGSIKQVKDRSLDPTLEVDQEVILKRLDTIAYIQELPVMIATIRQHPLEAQEKVLAQLVGKPVKIILTDNPPAMNLINPKN